MKLLVQEAQANDAAAITGILNPIIKYQNVGFGKASTQPTSNALF